MGKVVKVAGVVALMLELDAVPFAQCLVDPFDVAKSVGKDVGIGIEQVTFFPVVLPALIAARHRIEREIHRPHVERTHFRRKLQRRRHALLHRHGHGAAGGNVDYCVGRLLDARQEPHKNVWIRRRPPIFGVARMQMQNRGPGFGRIDRLRRDLIRRDRQCLRHRRGMDRTCDRAADNDFVCHSSFSFSSPGA